MWETWVRSQGWEDPLEESMATHSSIHAWRIPMDRGAWKATLHGGCKESDKTKQLSIAHNPTRIGMESVSESRKCYGKRHCLNWVLQFKSKFGGQERETSNTRIALEMTWLSAKNINSKKLSKWCSSFFHQAMQHVGSYFPHQELNRQPPALEVWRLNHWTSREVPRSYHLLRQWLSYIFGPWITIRNAGFDLVYTLQHKCQKSVLTLTMCYFFSLSYF